MRRTRRWYGILLFISWILKLSSWNYQYPWDLVCKSKVYLPRSSRFPVIRPRFPSPLKDSISENGNFHSNEASRYEIERRRNFAIISHPDAGKTTLTEKLLLFGGAIHDAGAVKARRNQRKATSDWMEIEKQRGISVTSTVLTFEYKQDNTDYHLNLLDTPGHQDFSEDTYRTLAAADNCVMLIDAAKGIEDRTRKLFEVCQMRQLPIFTFANKMDRPSLSPFEIMQQLEKEFKLEVCPMNWPIGNGEDFQGIYDRRGRKIHLFERGDRRKKIFATILPIDDPEVIELIGERNYKTLLEDIEMMDVVMPEPNLPCIRNGTQTPLFFGSAMNNFGVEFFLNSFLSLAQAPFGREANVTSLTTASAASRDNVDRSSASNQAMTPKGLIWKQSTSSSSIQSVIIEPSFPEFTGFIFKLQANLDPKHRDRMAFVRICSGKYWRGMKVFHSRSKKTITLSTAQSLFAKERELVEEAYPGDVIGIHNPGTFAIGDSIYTGNSLGRIFYPSIPFFSPEKFAMIRNKNPSTYKKYYKGLSDLLEEGAIQLLKEREAGHLYNDNSILSYKSSFDNQAILNGVNILAAVGQLQLDVVEYRLKSEYQVDCELEAMPFQFARWVDSGWESVQEAESAGKLYGVQVVRDRWNRPVLLFRNAWKMDQLIYPSQKEGSGGSMKLIPWSLPPSEFD